MRRCRVALSPGHPTDIGFSWARPAVLAAGKGNRGNVVIYSVPSLSLVPSFFHISLPFISSTVSSFSSLGDDTK